MSMRFLLPIGVLAFSASASFADPTVYGKVRPGVTEGFSYRGFVGAEINSDQFGTDTVLGGQASLRYNVGLGEGYVGASAKLQFQSDGTTTSKDAFFSGHYKNGPLKIALGNTKVAWDRVVPDAYGDVSINSRIQNLAGNRLLLTYRPENTKLAFSVDDNDFASFGASRKFGNVKLFGATNGYLDDLSNADYILGARFRISDDLTLGARFQSSSATTTTLVEGKYKASPSSPTSSFSPNFTISGSFARQEGSGFGSHQTSVGITHQLSKKTRLFGGYRATKPDSGSTTDVFSVGLRMIF